MIDYPELLLAVLMDKDGVFHEGTPDALADFRRYLTTEIVSESGHPCYSKEQLIAAMRRLDQLTNDYEYDFLASYGSSST